MLIDNKTDGFIVIEIAMAEFYFITSLLSVYFYMDYRSKLNDKKKGKRAKKMLHRIIYG